MKLSVCIDAVFMGEDIEKAIHKVKDMEIPAVEFWGWDDKDLEKAEKGKTGNRN